MCGRIAGSRYRSREGEEEAVGKVLKSPVRLMLPILNQWTLQHRR